MLTRLDLNTMLISLNTVYFIEYHAYFIEYHAYFKTMDMNTLADS